MAKTNDISIATERNFVKLNKDLDEHTFSKRANKRQSAKYIFPKEYCHNKNNYDCFQAIINTFHKENLSLETFINYLIWIYLIEHKIINETGKVFFENPGLSSFVKKIIKNKDDSSFKITLPLDEEDPIGIIYQSLLTEGHKNVSGSYYTPKKIVKDLIRSLDSESKSICDPCCGTGSFLISFVKDAGFSPKNVYGYDIDEIAVNIAKANLYILYPCIDFEDNIICTDFLKHETKPVDYIVTNPPWGAKPDSEYQAIFPEIKSKESFSYFILKSLRSISEFGKVIMLLPISFANVKVHQDIRKVVLDKYNLDSIKLYGKCFSGVLTDVISASFTKKKTDTYIYIDDKNNCSTIFTSVLYSSNSNVVPMMSIQDIKIIDMIKKIGCFSLKDFSFALGVVTGDNKSKLFNKPVEGSIPIYTGKDVSQCKLKAPSHFIIYNRDSFQQVAPDKYYFTAPKFIYRFISKWIVFAYDTNKSVVLNSANVMIKPDNFELSDYALLATLNSAVFNFYFLKVVNQCKILKNDLCNLPLPKFTAKEDYKINNLVIDFMKGKSDFSNIDDFIFKKYNFNETDIEYIKEITYGRIK